MTVDFSNGPRLCQRAQRGFGHGPHYLCVSKFTVYKIISITAIGVTMLIIAYCTMIFNSEKQIQVDEKCKIIQVNYTSIISHVKGWFSNNNIVYFKRSIVKPQLNSNQESKIREYTTIKSGHFHGALGNIDKDGNVIMCYEFQEFSNCDRIEFIFLINGDVQKVHESRDVVFK